MVRRILSRCIVLLAMLMLAGAVVTSSTGCSSNAHGKYAAAKAEAPSAGQFEITKGWIDPSELAGRTHDVRGQAASVNPPALEPGKRINGLQGGNLLDLIPLPNDELWIISKRPQQVQAPRDEQGPGSGALVTQDPRSQQMIPIPLKHTAVKASIDGYISTVDVTQQFENPFSGKIEAAYVFPLPQNAAINEFVMTIGDRRIRGIIRERQEAEQLYKEARAQGHVASLLTQERPNIFTQKVANIEPGKRIDVSIRYFNTLAYSDGWYEFVFPMVVGPRFNPSGSTNGVGAVGIGSRNASGQATEVQYLNPQQRSGHDISMTVIVDPGVAVEQVQCTSHRIKTSPARADRKVVVELDPSDTIPNKDFVLRYRVAGKDVKPGVVVHRDPKTSTGYFTLMLFPPTELNELPRSPVEMFFTLDVSGSMSGQPLAQSKAAMRYALTHMRADDTFQIVLFASDAKTMSPRPVPATPENIRAAIQFMDGTDSGGGTMMLKGIQAPLNAPVDESRPRFVTFLTDGYIGNEAEILGALHQSLGNSRVFSFGVGSSTNRYLLDHMARMGNGAVAYLGLNDAADPIMADYFGRISHPALSNVSIDWAGMQVTDVYPQKLPDLFVGRPVILSGKFKGDGKQTIKISGTVAGRTRQFEIPVNLDDSATHPALPAVWARSKIADLAEQSTYSAMPELPQQVKQVALEYGLMSSFTAFIAVDSMSKTAGEFGTTVTVPVPVPEGVRYDTTVTDRSKSGMPE